MTAPLCHGTAGGCRSTLALTVHTLDCPTYRAPLTPPAKRAMGQCTCGYITGGLKTNGGHRPDCPALYPLQRQPGDEKDALTRTRASTVAHGRHPLSTSSLRRGRTTRRRRRWSALSPPSSPRCGSGWSKRGESRVTWTRSSGCALTITGCYDRLRMTWPRHWTRSGTTHDPLPRQGAQRPHRARRHPRLGRGGLRVPVVLLLWRCAVKDMFSEEEVAKIKAAEQRVPHMNDAIAENAANRLAVATRAVELVAARGGTMTAAGVKAALSELRETVEFSRDLEACRDDDLLCIWQVGQHIAAQGACLAVAEKDRDDARSLYQQEVSLRSAAEAERERFAGLLNLAERKGVEDSDKIDRLRQERYDALSTKTTEGLSAAEWQLRTGKAERENVELRAQAESLHAAGAVLSAHVDKTAGEADEEPSTVETIAHREGFDTGAEAMRAACISDALEWARRNGYLNDFQMASLKGVLEGATP